jgi:hypothetical protein
VWGPIPQNVTPGENDAAPSDAIILFGGSNLNEWTNDKGRVSGWIVNNSVATVVKSAGLIVSIRQYADCQLHIEWKAPAEIQDEENENFYRNIEIVNF